MKYQEAFNNLELLHQELKSHYLEWASDKKDSGIGSTYNSLTIDYIKNVANRDLVNEIKTNLTIISNNNQNINDKYLILKELYLIHPSFHEKWFFSSHYKHDEIIKGRLGLKAYLTCKPDNTKTIKGITTFLLKRSILLENLFSSNLKKTLIEHDKVDNLENNIKLFIENYNKISEPSETLDLLPDLFSITNTLLSKTDYTSFNSIKNYNSWMFYAPCSINEGPIFYKKSNKSRIDIFNNIKSHDELIIREKLMNKFKIEGFYE
ncbi:MAG: hypothetical protein ABFC34_00385 [Methanobacterium sp.]